MVRVGVFYLNDLILMNHASLCSLNADSTQFVNNDPDMILIEDNFPSDQLLCYYLSSQKLLF